MQPAALVAVIGVAIPAARVVKAFPPRLTSLWLGALERPDNDLKCQAAATIALARRRGMPGLEKAVPALLRALDQPEQHPTVRLAAAQALIALDARKAAPVLFERAGKDGVEMRDLVEPALARWDYKPARAAWLEHKLGNPRIFDAGKMSSKPWDELLRMPNFALNSMEIELIATFIQSFTDHSVAGLVENSKKRPNAEEMATYLTGYTVVVTKSTVPVGTGREVARIIRAARPGA